MIKFYAETASTCANCGSPNFVTIGGATKCTVCGYVEY